MKRAHKSKGAKQHGIALLIAIFVLLLISVVAIALLVSSGTETALGANYRSSSTVYYAALAGLEEARGRLLAKNPDYFGPGIVPSPLPLTQPVYVLNQLPSETVAPWDSGNPYYDKEYATEFGTQASSVGYQPANSVWNNNAKGIPGPAYKWVRITAATEQSLNLDVNSSGGALDHTVPIYYDPSAVDFHGNPAPGLRLGPGPPSAVQVLQITALAALPNGSQKLLQYVVAPTGKNNLSFPAGLTFEGPNIGGGPAPFSLPYSASYWVRGDDQEFYSNGGGCPAGANPSAGPVRAIGVIDMPSVTFLRGLISGWHEYTGLGDVPGQANVYYVGNPPPPGPPTLSGSLQTETVSSLNSLVSTIAQGADATLNGTVMPVQQNDAHNVLPAEMSAANPMTVVVNGDFDTTGWTGSGYGILVVTGKFTYDVNSSWNGIVLVIGKGIFYSPQSSGGPGQINGAMLLATTLDSSYNPLISGLGTPTVNFNDGEGEGSAGIYYSSCWVQYVQAPTKYQVLSFHEIPQS